MSQLIPVAQFVATVFGCFILTVLFLMLIMLTMKFVLYPFAKWMGIP